MSPLHVAIKNNNIEAVKFIIDNLKSIREDFLLTANDRKDTMGIP